MANIFNRGEREETIQSVSSAVPYSAPRGLTASAVPIDMKQKREVEAMKDRKNGNEWQTEA